MAGFPILAKQKASVPKQWPPERPPQAALCHLGAPTGREGQAHLREPSRIRAATTSRPRACLSYDWWERLRAGTQLGRVRPSVHSGVAALVGSLADTQSIAAGASRNPTVIWTQTSLQSSWHACMLVEPAGPAGDTNTRQLRPNACFRFPWADSQTR